MMKEQKKMNNKGFSLVELIIVIAIMAILVGVLAPQFIKYVEKSRIATDMQNVQSVKTAVEAYVADAASSGTTFSNDIKINVGNSKIVVEDLPAGATIDGVDTTATGTALKSSGWPSSAVAYTFDCAGSGATYKWGGNSCTNGTYDMKTVFNITE